MKFLLSCLLLLSFVSSCKQNPYPSAGNSEDSTRTPQDDDRPEDRNPKPPLSLSVDSSIKFQEGRQLQYQIRAEVQSPGKPIMWIEDLPNGATFDDKEKVLTWKPSFFDGNDPKDPSIKVRTYKVKVFLRSSLLPKDQISEDVLLEVYDTPRAVKIIGSDYGTVSEGSTLKYKFKIENEDYPVGPFKVLTSGMPANTKVTQLSDTEYQLEYSPDYYEVNLKKDGSRVEYQGKIYVNNPANHVGEKEVEIRIDDTRLGVNLQTPNTPQTPVLEQGLDASFQIAAYDLNKEVTPEIELTSNRPNFGHFKMDLVENEDSSSSVLNVKWMDIPPEHNGETISIGFKACVLKYSSTYSNCTTNSIKVKIVVKDRKSPIINRNNWPVGELIYLGFKENFTRNIYVTDGEDPRIQPRVEVYPVEMRKSVSWSNNRLSMKFDKAGTHQFSLKAISDYKTSTSQSFIVEVFPEDRSKTLFFADSTRDPEVKFYQKHLKDVSLMNPMIQDINTRNISDRETLVLGTSILYDKAASSQILKAMSKIKNIVIASPLIDNMPDKFLDELRNDYNMDFIGRYNDLPRTPDITKTYFAYTSQFNTPKNRVGLKLNASSESHNPLIFNGGLDEPNKKCKGVLGLTDNGNNPLVIGVVCTRNNGGKITLLGTEWADLKVHQDDMNIPSSWFNTMLKGSF